MPGPEIAAEAGRAGIYAVMGGAALKLAEILLRRADRRQLASAAEFDANLNAGARIREELRKEIERREEQLLERDGRISKIEDELREVHALLHAETTRADDAEAELRMIKRSLRTPIPPSIPAKEPKL